MKITGITAEYNPFHNGHKLHFEESMRLTDTENLFVVMSGNFTQRGEPAIFDKYIRTKWALENGAGIVVELPCVFASASAEFFASAAVKIFNDSKICDNISFGAETDSIERLTKNARIISDENTEFKSALSQFLSQGLSYPAARDKAAEKLLGEETLISSPNNILACEYIKALLSLDSSIRPYAVKRTGNDYNQTETSGKYSSATSIRTKIFGGKAEEISFAVPSSTYNAILKGDMPVRSFSDLSEILNYRLRMLSAQDLTQYHGISEGLENRIIASLGKENYDADNLVSAIKSKRYTHTRIQRSLLHICLDIKDSDLMRYKENGYAPYIRVLGFRKDKEYMLKTLAENSEIPVITNIKNAHKVLDDYGMEILSKEIQADNIYNMLGSGSKLLNTDFTTPLVIV
ncbi:MAG: nucleotidyltransferase [Firmicutes bacterium]|nr:nucleotidyltransferase [Bacillota bacterium]